MCGRYFITLILSELEETFEVTLPEPLTPRYNAAPTQSLPVILNARPNEVSLARWGLNPPWLEKIKKTGVLINVRTETLREKPTFRSDFLRRRCLIPADGFYEWKKTPGGGKVPYCISSKNRTPFAFAGIWQTNTTPDGSNVTTFAIITTRANSLIAPIHDRMPAMLNPTDKDLWFSSLAQLGDLLTLLRPAPSDDLQAYEVSRRVNKASVDTPELLEPV